MLAQFSDSANDTAAVFGWMFVLASVAWLVFMVWWMITMKNEIQRIRMTFEHQVYDFDDDEGDDKPDIEQLRRLGELHRDGILTDDEFARLKEGFFASPEHDE